MKVRFLPPRPLYGRLAELVKALVLKTSGGKTSGGSNPSPSAIKYCGVEQLVSLQDSLSWGRGFKSHLRYQIWGDSLIGKTLVSKTKI